MSSSIIIGHGRARDAITAATRSSDGTKIIILSGGVGSGKTTLIDWLRRETPAPQLFDCREHRELISAALRSGEPVQAAIKAALTRSQPTRKIRASYRIAVYDDIDHDIPPETVSGFATALVASLDLEAVVFTGKTPPHRGTYPVPVQFFSLERREATHAEFTEYVARMLERHGHDLTSLTPELTSALYLLQTQCSDFRAVSVVVSRLSALAEENRQLNESDLYRLLREEVEPDAFRSFPGIRVSAGGRLVFRAKDKTEELCEIILGYYDDPNELAVVAAEDLSGFDAASFSAQAQPSYRDAVMAMCLVRSPIDLISSLLGPREVIREIRHRQLDQAREFDSPQARARLLARGLGFTISDEPVGYSSYLKAVASARALAGLDSTPSETLRGAGLSLAQNVELLLFDLTHFWACVLLGSMTELVREYNDARTGRPLQARRLTGGNLAALLRYLNRGSTDVAYTLGLLLTHRSQPFSDRLLAAIDTFVGTRNGFVHEHRDEGRSALQQRFSKLLDDAERVVRGADESYPVVVKLTEIMFDEFGRQVHSAKDSEGRVVRFALTREEKDRISISSHYFMMPAKPVTIDPVLVPRFGTDAGVLFREAEGYRQSSETQRSQSSKLLSRIDLSTRERVLDAGCGSGQVTLDLADRYPHLRVHGIDISAEMITVARQAARDRDNVTFYEADVLKYRPERPYDAIFSNSTMHWVLPAEAGYGALFRLLTPGGLLAVHQGGDQTYTGLRTCAREVIDSLGLTSLFSGWSYPAYYPTRAHIEQVLGATGFVDVVVVSDESDGREHPTLVRDFAYAGLLPFLQRVPEERRELVRSEFLRHAESTRPSLYQHRLYVTARRP